MKFLGILFAVITTIKAMEATLKGLDVLREAYREFEGDFRKATLDSVEMFKVVAQEGVELLRFDCVVKGLVLRKGSVHSKLSQEQSNELFLRTTGSINHTVIRQYILNHKDYYEQIQAYYTASTKALPNVFDTYGCMIKSLVLSGKLDECKDLGYLLDYELFACACKYYVSSAAELYEKELERMGDPLNIIFFYLAAELKCVNVDKRYRQIWSRLLSLKCDSGMFGILGRVVEAQSVEEKFEMVVIPLVRALMDSGSFWIAFEVRNMAQYFDFSPEYVNSMNAEFEDYDCDNSEEEVDSYQDPSSACVCQPGTSFYVEIDSNFEVGGLPEELQIKIILMTASEADFSMAEIRLVCKQWNHLIPTRTLIMSNYGWRRSFLRNLLHRDYKITGLLPSASIIDGIANSIHLADINFHSLEFMFKRLQPEELSARTVAALYRKLGNVFKLVHMIIPDYYSIQAVIDIVKLLDDCLERFEANTSDVLKWCEKVYCLDHLRGEEKADLICKLRKLSKNSANLEMQAALEHLYSKHYSLEFIKSFLGENANYLRAYLNTCLINGDRDISRCPLSSRHAIQMIIDGHPRADVALQHFEPHCILAECIICKCSFETLYTVFNFFSERVGNPKVLIADVFKVFFK